MKLTAIVAVILTCLFLMPTLAEAQVKAPPDRFGAPDTVFAEVARIDDHTFSITISYFNDENVVGIAVPIKMSAGLRKIVADSALYTGGRVQEWSYRGFRPDTAIQCVTLGMIANMGPTERRLTPGYGRLVTVFVSSLDEEPIEEFSIDTTTTSPGNYLMSIVDMYQGTPPDTTRIDFEERQMIPAWVVREAEVAAEPKK